MDIQILSVQVKARCVRIGQRTVLDFQIANRLASYIEGFAGIAMNIEIIKGNIRYQIIFGHNDALVRNIPSPVDVGIESPVAAAGISASAVHLKVGNFDILSSFFRSERSADNDNTAVAVNFFVHAPSGVGVQPGLVNAILISALSS